MDIYVNKDTVYLRWFAPNFSVYRLITKPKHKQSFLNALKQATPVYFPHYNDDYAYIQILLDGIYTKLELYRAYNDMPNVCMWFAKHIDPINYDGLYESMMKNTNVNQDLLLLHAFPIYIKQLKTHNLNNYIKKHAPLNVQNWYTIVRNFKLEQLI